MLTPEEKQKRRHEWNRKNHDKIRTYNQKYKKKNYDKLKPKRKEWDDKNRDKVKDYAKRTYKKHQTKRVTEQKEYYETNRDKVLVRQKEYNIRTSKDRKAWRQANYLKNIEKVKESNAQYYRENAEKLREQHRQYSKENRDKIKAWAQTPKGRYTSYKGNAKTRNISLEITFEEFMTFWQKLCHYCKYNIDTIGLDRIDNSKGYSLDNVVSCCHECNWTRNDIWTHKEMETIIGPAVAKVKALRATVQSNLHSEND